MFPGHTYVRKRQVLYLYIILDTSSRRSTQYNLYYTLQYLGCFDDILRFIFIHYKIFNFFPRADGPTDDLSYVSCSLCYYNKYIYRNDI